MENLTLISGIMIIDKTGKQVISNLRTDSNGNHYQRRVELAQIFELLN